MKHPPEIESLNPLNLILEEHDRQQVMCDRLEEIADGLPDSVDLEKARHIAEILKFELPQHHRIEEKALFPVLMKYAVKEDNAGEIVSRLNEEHVVDESSAEELIELLEYLARGYSLENANMFGYMLRGFFENYRRHILWENSFILPLARRRLPEEGLRTDITDDRTARLNIVAEKRECLQCSGKELLSWGKHCKQTLFTFNMQINC